MICFPNAKINLGLNIVSRRVDGYHNIETIFYPIGLKDALEIIPSRGKEKYRFFQTGIEIHGDTAHNLVIKAWQLMTHRHKIPPIDIHLLKKIPFGAGLGGGSADAAFMLKLLNDSFDLGYTPEQLMLHAATLGADCSFFIKNKPAFACGIGDELEQINIDISSPFFVLVKPNVCVPTKDAYAMVTPQKPKVSLKDIVKKPMDKWKEAMKNDFETSVFKKYPEIAHVKEQLYNLGATYASMSGSGSSVFAFFKEKTEIKPHFKDYFVWTNQEM